MPLPFDLTGQQSHHISTPQTPKRFPNKFAKWLLIGSMVWLCSINLTGCIQQGSYRETHNIANLKIVFLDDESLQKVWTSKSGKPSTQFQPWLRGNLASVKTVRGFYDFATKTLYCPKWNYEVCGHELHHAALGHFHPNH